MRSILSLLLIVALSGSAAHAQVLQYPDKAFELAQASGKKIMLVFSGSDWCIPCIRFNKQILSDSSFLSFAGENLVVLEADFPQRKKIAAPLRSQYDSLAAAFNPQGAFPQVVLLSPEKKLLAYVPYREETSAGFISTLKHLLQ
ncbi:thioredoxin family protein [Chitinophaga sp. S165]|uniref:thioredoxin family protein n=1 Tax=Chitinophaga sp. S165 TaxID=2135462 RepID=UPI000D710A4E|nr:thioredoxin family protein [Chitinophaga sp. S165]PWV50432.1 thioredoxin-like protein [Chitinophaga sp. S165]